ncbi:maleylpyruvate isomerase N-terminal domain-containing protein [Lacisediminihabitans sp.]|uniref:maleylpyruvate isomerase N-terminal domain-containing protein n=1 Tax=Lacisediminihabitans sp. TaxID=2787631 RepID=UPI00374CAEA0
MSHALVVPDIRSAHARALALADSVVAEAIGLDTPRLRTPCTEWDLEHLLRHMIHDNLDFARAALGRAPEESARLAPGEILAEWRRSARELARAVAGAPSSAVILMPEVRDEPLPADVAISFQLLDTLVHGWDVAVSAALPFACDAELAGIILGIAERIPATAAERAQTGLFAPPLAGSGSDSDFDRALRLLGRDPAWAPAIA